MLELTATNPANGHHSPHAESNPENEYSYFADKAGVLNHMLDVNDDIANFLQYQCDKLTFSMEQLTYLGRGIQFLALDDNEILQLQTLRSYLFYVNGACGDLITKTAHFADGRYDQFIADVPFHLTADQILRLGSPSRLEFAVAVTEEKFSTIKSMFAKNETKIAIDLVEMKKIEIYTEVMKLYTAIREMLLGTESLLSVTKIKNDFLKNVQEMAGDLEKQCEVLKLDELLKEIEKCIESITSVQKDIPMELALSFIA